MSENNREETLAWSLDWSKRGGLLPVIVQDHRSLEILMLGYVNPEALEASLRTLKATFWSTSRQTLWQKGETSGDVLLLEEVRVDCDQDALVFLVSPQGEGACHTRAQSGRHRRSCFYRRWKAGKSSDPPLESLEP